MTELITPKPAAKPKQKSLSFKAPQDVLDELAVLKKRVQKHSHQVDFNLDAVMAESLQKHIKVANQHLDKLEKTVSHHRTNDVSLSFIDE